MFTHTKLTSNNNLYRRVKVPTLIQMEAVECGAASLGMILAYYRRFVSLDELRFECGVSRDGCNLFGVSQAAEHYGLECIVYQKKAEELMNLEPPFIVFWEYVHFLVVEGFKGNKVYLNDPSIGRRTVDFETFAKSYVGIVATFQKTISFIEGGVPPPLLKDAISKLKKSKGALSYLILTGFSITFFSSLFPWFMKIFYDDILGKQYLNWGPEFSISFCLLVILSSSSTLMQYFTFYRLNLKLSIIYSSKLFWQLLQLPISFYQQRYSGEIANRMSLSDAAIQGLTGIIARSFVSLIFVLFYVIIMCILSLPIALIGIVLSLINIGLMWGVQRVRYDFTVATQHYNSKFMGFTIGTITYIETIKSSGSELNVFKKWASLFTKITNSSQRAQILNTYLSMLPGFFNSLGTIAIFFVGGHLLINQSFTIGLLMGLQGLIGFLLSPVIELSNSFKVIQGIKINMARVNDVMEQKIDPIFSQEKDLKKDNISPQITINRKIEKYDRLSGSFEFRDVTFGYSRLEPPLIENFNLIVKPGQRIALIGSTGCGKSTLGKLLTGLLEPWSGEILYDGKKRSTFDRNILVDSITSVDQEIFLFSGTIRENILMLDNTVMDHLMIQAAKDACIHDEILNKKSDYNHVLIENGRNLSGGQRQRLEIARSLVCDPQILILDEATSSLDSNMEAQIIRNVRRRGCSCLIIAHRLSTIRDCDEIILLDKGKVIQRGSHEQLKGQPGIYCDLIAKEGS